MKKGLIHLYYGKGKGKSTAAMGLALRAAGAGLDVVVAQFMKPGTSSEIKMLEQIPNVRVIRVEGKVKFSFNMTDEDKVQATKAHNDLLAKAAAVDCDLLVLDESINAYRLDLIDKDALKQAVLDNPETREMVLTGRGPDDFFIEHADYVTEMVCHKHPFKEQGIAGRLGVEY